MSHPARSHPARLAFSVALLLERLSKNVQPAPKGVPLPRHQYRGSVADLRIEQPLRAVERPPTHFEFIREDEYFERVERLFGSLE